MTAWARRTAGPLLALTSGAVLLGGCRGGGPPEGPPATGAVVRAPPSPFPALAAVRASDGSGDAEVEAGMPRIAVVLDDPRLARAREREAAGDPSAAAAELDRVRAATPLAGAPACAWSYTSGRLHLAATGEEREAVAAFEAAAGAQGAKCALAGYARLREAQALVRLSRPAEALACLRDLGEPPGAHEEATLVKADALVQQGDRAAAVPLWRALLDAAPHGLRWVDTSLQLARALLDGADGPVDAHAREALERATRVVVEVPLVGEKAEVRALRDRAAKAAHLPEGPRLTLDERVRQAQAWLEALQPRRAREVATGVVEEAAPAGPDAEVACRAAVVRARAMPHGRAEELEQAWTLAITRCRAAPESDSYASALYQGGRASANAKHYSEALARFAEVERRFASHRLADDARYHAALLTDDAGDSARALAMLGSIPDLYPDGDMAGDALFRVGLARLRAGDLAGAKAAFDGLLDPAPRGTGAMPLTPGAIGRAEYFRARVAELAGERDDAVARYSAIVARRPLSYPMLLAFGRLRAIDDALARRTIQAAVRSEPTGPFLTRSYPELESEAFDRFARLLEVGEIEAARREASAGGWLADGVDDEVRWTVAWLFDRAGAPSIGHAFARARLVDFRSHWPVGRWRLPWEVAFPRPWAEWVVREGDANGVPAPLAWAIMREESAFDPEARSAVGAVGLMQLMTATAQKTAQGTPWSWDEASLRRPEVSIALGARLLASLRASFAGHPELAVAAYNGGGAAVRRWLAAGGADEVDVFVERIAYDETRNYVKRVLASQAAYAYLYAPASLDELTALVGGGHPAAAVVASGVTPPLRAEARDPGPAATPIAAGPR